MRTSVAAVAVAVLLTACAEPRVFKAQSSPLPTQSAQPPSDGDPASLAPPGSSTASLAPPGSSAASPSSAPPVGQQASATVGGTVVTCPDPSAADAGGAASTPLKPDIEIVAVVRCETVTRTYTGASWTVQLAEVADSGLVGFVTALRQPSQSPSTGVACPLFRIALPWFALVAKDGTVVHASLPVTGCGQPQAAAVTALSALPFHDVEAVRVQQISSSGG